MLTVVYFSGEDHLIGSFKSYDTMPVARALSYKHKDAVINALTARFSIDCLTGGSCAPATNVTNAVVKPGERTLEGVNSIIIDVGNTKNVVTILSANNAKMNTGNVLQSLQRVNADFSDKFYSAGIFKGGSVNIAIQGAKIPSATPEKPVVPLGVYADAVDMSSQAAISNDDLVVWSNIYIDPADLKDIIDNKLNGPGDPSNGGCVGFIASCKDPVVEDVEQTITDPITHIQSKVLVPTCTANCCKYNNDVIAQKCASWENWYGLEDILRSSKIINTSTGVSVTK